MALPSVEKIPPSFGAVFEFSPMTVVQYIRMVPHSPEKYSREEVLELVRNHRCGISEDPRACLVCKERICYFCTGGICSPCAEKITEDYKERQREEEVGKITELFKKVERKLLDLNLPDLPRLQPPTSKKELEFALRTFREYREKNDIGGSKCEHLYTRDYCSCGRKHICLRCEKHCFLCQRFLSIMESVADDHLDNPAKKRELERKKKEIRSLMRLRNKKVSFKSDREKNRE